MNQKEFIDKLYASKRFKSREQITLFLELFWGTFKESLTKEEKVVFKNVGTFSLKEIEKNIYIPTRKKVEEKIGIKTVKFKASKNFIKELKESELK